MVESRRNFLKSLATSLVILNLCELATLQKALASAGVPIITKWLRSVEDLARSVKNDSITQLEWKSAMENLYRHVPMNELLSFINFETLARNTKNPNVGESFVDFVLPKIEGTEGEISFYKDLGGFRKGRSIPPHGHNGLVSSFMVLQGSLRGRHFDRVSDEESFMHIRRSSDRSFIKGDSSTISQNKDNVHWFTALEENSFIIDFGVGGLKKSGAIHALPSKEASKRGRIYLDVDSGIVMKEKNYVRAERITEESAYALYGADSKAIS